MTALLASIGYERWVLQVLLALPLLGMTLVILSPKEWARVVALVVALFELFISLGLWWAFDPAKPGLQFVTRVDWLPQFGVSYYVGLDGLSLFMVLLSTAMMPLLVWGSWNQIDFKQRGFYALLLALKTGMLGVFVSLDLFLFYCFWELLLIPMYFIVGIWGSGNRAVRRDEVLHLHRRRLAAPAGGHHRERLHHRRRHRYLLTSTTTHFSRTGTGWRPSLPGSLPRSRSRSRSRCRSSRSTPGCRTRTPRRPPRARSMLAG